MKPDVEVVAAVLGANRDLLGEEEEEDPPKIDWPDCPKVLLASKTEVEGEEEAPPPPKIDGCTVLMEV